MFDPTKVQGIGMDELDSGSSLPLIKILQKGSAEVDQDHPDYPKKGIRGARTGNLVFAPESKILPQPLTIIPLARKSLYEEWRPKKSGGGRVASHPLSIVADPRYSKGKNPEKPYNENLGENDLVLTDYWMVMFLDEDEWKKGILAMTSAQLKHSRAMNSQIKKFVYEDKNVKPFIFSRTFNVSTKKVEKEGNTWYEFDIVPDRVLDFTEDAQILQDAYEAREDAVASLPKPETVNAITDDGVEPF